MTSELLLKNVFFAFWYIFENYFFAIWGFAIFIGIVVALVYFLTRR